eukprot:2942182-Rhodomonas_salina.1
MTEVMARSDTLPTMPRVSDVGEGARKKRRPQALTRGLFVPLVQEEVLTMIGKPGGLNSPTPKNLEQRRATISEGCNPPMTPLASPYREAETGDETEEPASPLAAARARPRTNSELGTVSFYVRRSSQVGPEFNLVPGVLVDGQTVCGMGKRASLKEFVNDVKKLDLEDFHSAATSLPACVVEEDGSISLPATPNADVPPTPSKPSTWSPGESAELRRLLQKK